MDRYGRVLVTVVIGLLLGACGSVLAQDSDPGLSTAVGAGALAAAPIAPPLRAPATETPTPTPTPPLDDSVAPAPTPQATPPGPTARVPLSEEEYVAAMGQIGLVYSAAWATVDELMMQAAQAPTLMADSEWISNMATALATVELSNDQVRAIEPPARYRDPHEEFVAAAEHYGNAVSLLIEGIAERDGEKIGLAHQEVMLGAGIFLRASEKLEQPIPDHEKQARWRPDRASQARFS